MEELLESPYVVRFMSDFVAKKGSLENAQRPKPRGIEHQSPYKQSPGETPKEAVARRKREAADEEAETLKCAIKDVAERKQFAKQLRDEQMNRTCTAGTSWRKDHNGEANETIIPQRRSLQETFRREPLDDSFGEDTWKFSTRSLIDLTDDGKTNESSETYEDDFEEESEDDMSTTNKSDFSRVMDNYQQQLTRLASGAERPVSSLPASKVSLGPANMANRTCRIREECIRLIGDQRTFDCAYTFLCRAHKDEMSEKEIRKGVVKRIGAEAYKRCGFSLDQLAWQDSQRSIE